MANTPGTCGEGKKRGKLLQRGSSIDNDSLNYDSFAKRLERYGLAFDLLLVISFQVLREKRRGARSSVGRVCGASASYLGPSLRLKKKISSTHLRASNEKNKTEATTSECKNKAARRTCKHSHRQAHHWATSRKVSCATRARRNTSSSLCRTLCFLTQQHVNVQLKVTITQHAKSTN